MARLTDRSTWAVVHDAALDASVDGDVTAGGRARTVRVAGAGDAAARRTVQRRQKTVAVLDAARELVEAQVSVTADEDSDDASKEREDEQQRCPPAAIAAGDHGPEGAVSRSASGRATPAGNRER